MSKDLNDITKKKVIIGGITADNKEEKNDEENQKDSKKKEEIKNDEIKKEEKHDKNKLPPWKKPTGINTGIKVLNSFTQEKDDLILPDDGVFKWYTCGPTVYDSSHMGHARTYLAFDIIRRILEDYFQYDLTYVINITDVDDKIIKKANLLLLIKFTNELDNKKIEENSNLKKIYENAKKRIKEDSEDPTKALSNVEICKIYKRIKK